MIEKIRQALEWYRGQVRVWRYPRGDRLLYTFPIPDIPAANVVFNNSFIKI